MYRFRPACSRAVALLTAFALGGAACGSVATAPSPTAPRAVVTPSPAATLSPTAPSPTGSPGTTSVARALGTDPETKLAPGVYRTDDPPMEFEIPATADEMKWFGRRDPVRGGWGIRKATDPCDGCEVGHIVVIVRVGSVTGAVAEWMSLEGADLSDAEPVELGGARGLRFEGTVPAALSEAVVHNGYHPEGIVRVHVLEVAGEPVVVVANQYTEAEPFLEDAQGVIDSFQFGE